MTPGRSVSSPDGVKIVYDVDGDGPDTVVFVHGWACNRSHWRAQVRAFSPRYRTIALDLAGHGESGLNRAEWTMPSFAGDVAAVLDQEQVERAVIVGHSMGGRVILHVAQQLGERVVGLVGADTLKHLRTNPGGSYIELIQALEDDYKSAAGNLIAGMFTNDSPDALRKSVLEGMLTTLEAVGIGAMKGMMDDVPPIVIAANLSMPIVVINAHGSVVDMDAADEAGMDFRSVTTTGHFVMIEDPDTFNRLLADALEKMF